MHDAIGKMIGAPEVGSIQKFYSTRGPGAWSGEKRLMWGVLERAVDDLHNYTTKDANRIREGARRWITTDQDWHYSFENVCRTLGLEPSAVRHALLGD